jgi:hypothetical protein
MNVRASDEKPTRFAGLPDLRAYKNLTPETVRARSDHQRSDHQRERGRLVFNVGCSHMLEGPAVHMPTHRGGFDLPPPIT